MNLLNKKRQKGASFIEVLIVMVIISGGVMSLTRLQLFNMQNVSTNYFDTQVTIHMHEIIQQLRANTTTALAGDYNTGLIDTTDIPSNSLLSNWGESLIANVPSSQFTIDCNGLGLCLIAIRYTAPQNIATSGIKEQIITTQL